MFSLHVEEWYSLSVILGVDLNSAFPLARLRSNVQKRIIFAVWMKEISDSIMHEEFWAVMSEQCSTRQELEHKLGKKLSLVLLTYH